MKNLLIFLLIISSLCAEKLTVGAGPYIQTQPYKDVKDIVLPSPVIFYDNGIVYIRWSRAGVYFLGEKSDDFSWGFSLTAQPRPNNYKPSDSSYLQGLDEKKSSFEGGLAFSAKYKDSYIEVMALTDLLERYDSWIVKTEIGHDFKLGEFSFYPSLIAIYHSSEFNQYYYGISQKEATHSSYDAYLPKSDMQYGLQTYISYPITEKISTLINIRADLLSSQNKNSPLVEDEYIYSGLLSLIYTFEF